jgi:hypothetical protein
MPDNSCLNIEPRDFGRLAVEPTPNACRSPIMGSPDQNWVGARDGPGLLSHREDTTGVQRRGLIAAVGGWRGSAL